MNNLTPALRDLRIVGRGIWLNLLLFACLILVGAILLQLSGAYPDTAFLRLLVDSFHMAHLESVSVPPTAVLPELLVFILPVFSIVILGEGALRVLSLYLMRRERREEWDLLVAQTFSKHTVILGIGELGRAVFRQLIKTYPDRSIVLVDTRPGILAELRAGPNVCQVQADMTNQESLKAANCQHASLIILASGNDAYNLEAGFKALQINPNAEIWIRLYRAGLASLMETSTKSNVHFFSPYDRAAEALVAHIADSCNAESKV